jgi:hypothetical protein
LTPGKKVCAFISAIALPAVLLLGRLKKLRKNFPLPYFLQTIYIYKGVAQVSQTGNGQITLAWLSTGATDSTALPDPDADQAPRLIEGLSSSS